jgi:DUF971 family protein
MSSTVSTDPLHLAISKSKGITIDWSDGHTSRLPIEYLRDECPCASCTGSHGTPPEKSNYSNPQADPFPRFKPKLRMNDIEEVGSYAIRLHWNDGHSAGIYSYSYLRGICPCDECRQARREGRLDVSP